MRVARAIGWLGLIAMTAVLFNGFVNGSFTKDGAELLRNPWGIVSLVDLYVGFVLFSLWIALREKNLVVAATWIALMMTLGFLTGSLYLLVALHQGKGDLLKVILGDRKDQLLRGAK